MKIEAYVMAWNEAETIHLTVKHYQEFCNKVIIYDNFSDDNTREIAIAYGCEVRLFGRQGILDDREYTKLKNNCWKGSDADFVIIVDADEILWWEDPFKAFNGAKANKNTIFSPYGWNVFSEDIPQGTWLDTTNGYHYENYSKMAVFNPYAINEINYIHGCHTANPQGIISHTPSAFNPVLFHYRNVGGYKRLSERHELYRSRMSDWNIRWGAGGHYLEEETKRKNDWYQNLQKSKPYYQGGFSQ